MIVLDVGLQQRLLAEGLGTASLFALKLIMVQLYHQPLGGNLGTRHSLRLPLTSGPGDLITCS